ncbi:hotdog fold domain-containing protein [Thalassotalea ponticola]|uniref:hotdog fold domain-containing protein n=1 Tax=Thalassotalea ponticola TaxID=1523392 RepID=UPI0025B4A733|nr:hotdog fold domain-containing protein [Thalassotalea ponticola]MDN3651688.1 hotdog fold domain-containing protein [Thalassotalea ponticola]
MAQNKLLEVYEKWSKFPFGNRLFSWFFARWAPYFKTINPQVKELRNGYCKVVIPKRKSVENHIGTVHAIAVCNGMELAMGAVCEASIPSHLRWIPKSMTVDYTAKAGSDVTCIADLAGKEWQPGDFGVPVEAFDENGVTVAKGVITVWVSNKKK